VYTYRRLLPESLEHMGFAWEYRGRKLRWKSPRDRKSFDDNNPSDHDRRRMEILLGSSDEKQNIGHDLFCKIVNGSAYKKLTSAFTTLNRNGKHLSVL
jgi:hypothetical protein